MTENILKIKEAGDAATRSGNLGEAFELYTQALEIHPDNVAVLCNRSMVALKLDNVDAALNDAGTAWNLVLSTLNSSKTSHEYIYMACHRFAKAQIACGHLIDALKTYRRGITSTPPNLDSPHLKAALRVAMDDLPPFWWAKYWCMRIEAAQAPHSLSSRDGKLLKPVPVQDRLGQEELEQVLRGAFESDDGEECRNACETLHRVWCQGKPPCKAEVAYFRALAYLHYGNAEQALKDTSIALVYGPTHLVKSTERSSWAAALALCSAAYEAKGDNLPAAINISRALQLYPDNNTYTNTFERLLRRIPEHLALILSTKGVDALEATLAAQKEASKPEYLKQRPKYYYYYEWMRERIATLHPQLPEPVMDKMLTLEAGELDLLLAYPAATARTVEHLQGVLEEDGEEKLATYQVPLLSWDEWQDIKKKDGDVLQQLPAGETTTKALPMVDSMPEAAANQQDQEVYQEKQSADCDTLMQGGVSEEDVVSVVSDVDDLYEMD